MGFSFTLEALDDRRTRIRNESFYRPLTVMARVMSVLIMHRKFAALRRRVLANLKALAEQPEAATAAPARIEVETHMADVRRREA